MYWSLNEHYLSFSRCKDHTVEIREKKNNETKQNETIINDQQNKEKIEKGREREKRTKQRK